MKTITESAEETKKLAQKVAKDLLSRKNLRDSAIVVALEGDLGSGKTTFSQGFLSYFGIKRATSPTFVIMKKYGTKKDVDIYHLDCYRVHNSRDLLELNLEEIIKNPKNIVLIEWAERIKDVLPKNTVWIKFEHESEEERIINL